MHRRSRGVLEILPALAFFLLPASITRASTAPLFPNSVYLTGFRAFGVASGDFNGDGVVDLATGGFLGGQYLLAVLPGRGDGTFGPPVTTNVAAHTILSVAGDLNGDGRADLVGKREFSLSVHLGQADGHLLAGPTIALTARGYSLGEIDGDGHLDLAVTTSGARCSLSLN